MSYRLRYCWTTLASVALAAVPLAADDARQTARQAVYPVAVLAFQERGRDVETLGSKVTDLLFASLVIQPNLYLVERNDLDKLLQEQEVNISGIVDAANATRVGQLTGAKIIVSGSVLQVGDSLHLVAKIIGTETSRVLGATAKGETDEELDKIVGNLAEKITDMISSRAGELIPPSVEKEDRLVVLKKKLGNDQRPVVYVEVTERHIGQTTIDPAAQTEILLYCRELGFEVVDTQNGRKEKADVVLAGEGISEFCTRRGNLVSVKPRLEIKAVDVDTGKVLASDRQTTVHVDLAEQIAGKSALQEAAAAIAERILPKLVNRQ